MKLVFKDYAFVGTQFMLFLAYLFEIPLYSFKKSWLVSNTGILICVVGVMCFIVAILQLNKNLSPFPTPKSKSKLIKNGLYKYIRHPIYTGILMITFGYGFYINSSFKIIISIILLVLFYYKSLYEEKRLQNKFSEYLKYKETTGRFIPKF